MLSDSDIEILNLAKDIISQNPFKEISIPSLSIKIGLNWTKLKYGFKQLFGTGVHTFQTQLRLKKATELLDETNMPVKTIASVIGYGNNSSFSVAFKNQYKTSPSKYRKR